MNDKMGEINKFSGQNSMRIRHGKPSTDSDTFPSIYRDSITCYVQHDRQSELDRTETKLPDMQNLGYINSYRHA